MNALDSFECLSILNQSILQSFKACSQEPKLKCTFLVHLRYLLTSLLLQQKRESGPKKVSLRASQLETNKRFWDLGVYKRACLSIQKTRRFVWALLIVLQVSWYLDGFFWNQDIKLVQWLKLKRRVMYVWQSTNRSVIEKSIPFKWQKPEESKSQDEWMFITTNGFDINTLLLRSYNSFASTLYYLHQWLSDIRGFSSQPASWGTSHKTTPSCGLEGSNAHIPRLSQH